MKQSMRAKRMARNHKRMKQPAKLSLVSLMDIFTILVFFLMLNASDVQVLDNHKSVTLPESSADTAAQETLLLMVNQQELILQGRKVASVPDVLATSDDNIASLAQELTYQAGKAASPDDDKSAPRAITIMGDEAVPYQLLKKIMQTCASAGYTNISLAVEHIAGTVTEAST
ncbi:ExbD/TolR family protein [Aestuariibacter salexigens]|uniref:ExbD/TolR family protein n=1 Tax=Aestuariibacter salexigens TaxID=226010 RepID=UPI00041640FA|nr:biopolymer transporter ExbD [Aestuariibacter salexigens]